MLYRDFVDTRYNSYREIAGQDTSIGYAGRELISTQMWPCLPWIPTAANGGARGFEGYFNNGFDWRNTKDPDMDMKASCTRAPPTRPTSTRCAA